MPENKTVPNKLSVTAFLEKVTEPRKRADATAVMEMMRAASKERPVMWGPSIIGFGSCHYKYESGREGDMPLIGFSPRKQSLVLYLCGLEDELAPDLEKLGPHSVGKSCLYIKRLDDVDVATLRKMIAKSLKRTKKRQAAGSGYWT
jgi:hypothetical protein